MKRSKAVSIVLLILGIGLLAVSLLADVAGFGDNAGFGNQQILGAIAGAVVAAIGLFLMLKTGS